MLRIQYTQNDMLDTEHCMLQTRHPADGRRAGGGSSTARWPQARKTFLLLGVMARFTHTHTQQLLNRLKDTLATHLAADSVPLEFLVHVVVALPNFTFDMKRVYPARVGAVCYLPTTMATKPITLPACTGGEHATSI